MLTCALAEYWRRTTPVQQAKTEVVGNKKIKFQIWDTAGQEKYVPKCTGPLVVHLHFKMHHGSSHARHMLATVTCSSHARHMVTIVTRSHSSNDRTMDAVFENNLSFMFCI